MDAETVALASAGATALVSQMTTPGWESFRDDVAALFGRYGPRRIELVAEDLDASRTELVAAGESAADGAPSDIPVDWHDMASDIEAEWRARFRRLLVVDPGTAAALRELLEALPPGSFGVHNTISGGAMNGPVIQGRDIQGSITFGPTAAPAGTPPGPDFGEDDEWD